MAFRQVARATEKFHITWPDRVEASSVVEDDATAIGEFLLQIGHALRPPECEPGTLKGATYYVTRLFDYHRNDSNYPLSLFCSTVVRDQSDGLVVGVCLVGGGGEDGETFGIYDIQVAPDQQNCGIGTRMIKRALSILSDHNISEFHLWRNDSARACALYERLGFESTGKVE